MLNGIDQLEMLDEHYDLVKQSLAHGVNPATVSNFQGKEILDNLHELKIQYDRDYFNRQTYREFLADPLGAKLMDAWAATDPDVKSNVSKQGRVVMNIQRIAELAKLEIDAHAPSKQKLKQIEEEQNRKKQES